MVTIFHMGSTKGLSSGTSHLTSVQVQGASTRIVVIFGHIAPEAEARQLGHWGTHWDGKGQGCEHCSMIER